MVADEPRWVLAPNPSPMTLDGTRTYIVGNAAPVVIDPGPAVDGHVRRVLEVLDGMRPVAIVCTHSHSDHAGAAAMLARATGAPLIGQAQSLGRRSHGRNHEARGRTIVTDAGPLRIVPTPGHSPDHVGIHWSPEGRESAVFAGDLLLGQGDTTFVGDPDGDLDDYLSSLDLVESWGCDVAYPAHGPPGNAGELIDRHRRHKLRRIEQVRVIRSRDPDLGTERLVDAIYGSALADALRPAAAASIRAIERHLGRSVARRRPGDR